ncbi:MAG: CBS domain-containing protein [Chloroflexi bacterium]|nr:MAG: CBS domain-containing protein [Chloroflexota bacterium]
MVLIIIGVLVGIGTGLGAFIFNRLIEFITDLSFHEFPVLFDGIGRGYLVVVPVLGGLIVGPMIYYFAREAKGHGVPEVMQAIALEGGRIRPIVVVIKALASSITIGTGGSVGREGPIVQIGAALGSTLGQVLGMPEARIRNLVASGAAGGIAATFNAPIAGVMFAVEVIQGEFNVSSVTAIVIAAVTADALTQAIEGAEQVFPIPQVYTIESLWEFGFYVVLAVLAALIAVLFVRTLYWLEDLFEYQQKHLPEWIQPAVGGALLGGLALAYPLVFPSLEYDLVPQVFGTGVGEILEALSNQKILFAALVLMFLKIMATNITLGSGGSGGVFAPSLFMGAMLGTIVGIVVNNLFPGLTAPPGAYALVGMAAVFAGAAHAPITAIVMLFELTRDYRIILPLMLTVIIATMISRRLLGGESIYTLKLTRRGIRLHQGRDVDLLQNVLVGEVMTREIDTVNTSVTLLQITHLFSHSHHHGFPILDSRGKLWGLVTLSDLDRAIAQNLPPETAVTEIGTPYDRLIVTYPDEAIGDVLNRMGRRGLGRMPIVSREDPHLLLGMIRREDIVRGYNIAQTRRAAIQQQTEHLKTKQDTERPAKGEFIELGLTLSGDDIAVGKKVKDIAPALPDECILVSIQRNESILIPHGDTVFQPGDQVTAFICNADIEALYHCLLNGTR